MSLKSAIAESLDGLSAGVSERERLLREHIFLDGVLAGLTGVVQAIAKEGGSDSVNQGVSSLMDEVARLQVDWSKRFDGGYVQMYGRGTRRPASWYDEQRDFNIERNAH